MFLVRKMPLSSNSPYYTGTLKDYLVHIIKDLARTGSEFRRQ
jgi:hypothetical protein